MTPQRGHGARGLVGARVAVLVACLATGSATFAHAPRSAAPLPTARSSTTSHQWGSDDVAWIRSTRHRQPSLKRALSRPGVDSQSHDVAALGVASSHPLAQQVDAEQFALAAHEYASLRVRPYDATGPPSPVFASATR